MYSRRRDTEKSSNSEASSASSELISTSLQSQIHRAVVKPKYHKVETQGFVPRSQLDELIKVDVIVQELRESMNRSIRRRFQKKFLDFRPSTSDSLENRVRITASQVCGVVSEETNNTKKEPKVTYRKIVAIILLCGEKIDKVQAFIDEGVTDSALPPVIHTVSKRFELRVKDKPDTRLRCFNLGVNKTGETSSPGNGQSFRHTSPAIRLTKSHTTFFSAILSCHSSSWSP